MTIGRMRLENIPIFLPSSAAIETEPIDSQYANEANYSNPGHARIIIFPYSNTH